MRAFTLVPATFPLLVAMPFFDPWVLLALTIPCIAISSAICYCSPKRLHMDEIVERKYPKQIRKLKELLQSYQLPIIIGWSFFLFLPTDVLCYVCGSLKINFKKFLFGVVDRRRHRLRDLHFPRRLFPARLSAGARCPRGLPGVTDSRNASSVAIETASSKTNCTHDFASGKAEIEIVRLRDAAQFGARDAVSRVSERRLRAAIHAGKPRAGADSRDEVSLMARSPLAGQRLLSGSGI